MKTVTRFYVKRIEEGDSRRTYGEIRFGEARVRVEAEGDNYCAITFTAMASEWSIGEPVDITVEKVSS